MVILRHIRMLLSRLHLSDDRSGISRSSSHGISPLSCRLGLGLGPHWATGTRNVTGYWALASGATLQRHSDRDVILNNIYHSHSLIWRPSRVADTPPLLPISRYGYCLFVADVCLCSEVLQPGGSRSSSGYGSMKASNHQVECDSIFPH